MTAALAAIFSRLGPDAPVLHCLHVNHNIRNAAECSGDEKAAAALCESLSLPFHIHRVPRGMIQERAVRRGTGLEAAARRFRYAAFVKEARRLGARAILTAHTRDDRLETILMAVLRGSGPAGLGAMSAPYTNPPAIPVIRPLLYLTHEDALAYLAGRGLSHRTDPSNADTRFFRSRVRHLLVPLLNREFSGWEQPLLRLNETQALAASFLAGEASRLSWENTDGGLSLPSKDFFALSPLVREEALFAALDTLDVPGGGETRPRRDAVRVFASGSTMACDLGKFRLENTGGHVRAKRYDSSSFQSFSVLIKSRGTYKLDLSGGLVCEVQAAEMSREVRRSGGFYAGLPLVLRRTGQAARIEALDAKGRAAFLDLQGNLLQKRSGADAAFYCTISLIRTVNHV
jgi:tRNA(Ile)-lysidine synthase